jgi:hypothetical protein
MTNFLDLTKKTAKKKTTKKHQIEIAQKSGLIMHTLN